MKRSGKRMGERMVAAVRKIFWHNPFPAEGPPSSLEDFPSSRGREDGKTRPAQGTDQPMSEARPDREMVQTGPGERTDQPASEYRPAYEMGQTGLFADPQ